jgi:hypothetical protein
MTIDRWIGVVILIAVLSVGPRGVQAKVYSVQVGAFQIQKNAQACSTLFKTTKSDLSDHLRIERQGPFYKVKVGKLGDPEKAMALLRAIKAHWPEAFMVSEETKPEMIPGPTAKGIESVVPPAPPRKEPPPLEKKEPDRAGKTDTTDPAKRTHLTGIISEIIPLDSEQLGLPPGNTIFQLIIWVEGVKAISGATDMAQIRVGELTTFYSETRPAVLKSGNKIIAMLEYRGNPFGRYYWIVEPQLHKP